MIGLLFLTLAACGGRTVGATDGGAPSIVGDWFECKDIACNTISDDGMRFGADGTLRELNAPGAALEPGERYCVSARVIFGTYTWDGASLTMEVPGAAPVSTGLVIDGDRASYSLGGSSPKTGTLIRVNPPRPSGPCP